MIDNAKYRRDNAFMHDDFELTKFDFDRAKAFVSGLRRQGTGIGLTNGCFELFHYGHSEFLKGCKRALPWRMVLIVAVNGDQSFRMLKHRTPVVHEEFRRSIVASHMSVGFAFIWPNMRVTEVLQVLQPEYWFKGADYKMSTLDKDELAAAKAAGTKVQLIDHVAGQSTSNLIDTIKRM